jgi:hypothetical protein
MTERPMKVRMPLVLLAAAAAVLAVRKLAARSNTQVHRINQK